MAITRQTPQVEISNTIVASTNNLNGAIIHSMEVAGQQGTNEARAHGEYTDQTGSLRSSTGDVISDDGVIKSSSSFETVKNGSEGSVKGKSHFVTFVRRVCAVSLVRYEGRTASSWNRL